MTPLARVFKRDNLFPLVIGPMDGILTALTFSAGRILTPGRPIDTSLALRIAVAAAVSGGFVFFVAEYARLRGELAHAERHLNLTPARRLAQSRLGRAVLRDAFRGALIATITGFAGALLPTLLGTLLSGLAWVPLTAAVTALGLLGILIAPAARGSRIYWAGGAMLTGILVSVVGILLDVT